MTGLLILGITDSSHSRSAQWLEFESPKLGFRKSVSWAGFRPDIRTASNKSPLTMIALLLSAILTGLKFSHNMIIHYRSYSTVLIAHPSQLNIWLAVPLAKFLRKRIVIDFYVGLKDTLVDNRRMVGPTSVYSRILGFMDKLTLQCADHVIFDSKSNLQRFSANLIAVSHKSSVVYPSPPTHFMRPENLGEPTKDVIFIGHFSPLQGVEVILRALSDTRLSGITATIIGSENNSQLARRAMSLENIDYQHETKFRDFPEIIANHKIALGVFGLGAKSSSVLPNKVIEALRIGVPVITQRGALELEFGQTGCLFIEPGNSEALVTSIQKLLSDNKLRAKLQDSARKLVGDVDNHNFESIDRSLELSDLG